MASEKAIVDRVAGLLTALGTITARQMFGEWALYVEAKLVLLICDNKVFVKPTAGGLAYLGTPVLAPAYPGAKDSIFIESPLDDRDRFVELVRITAKELPEPKPKKVNRDPGPVSLPSLSRPGGSTRRKSTNAASEAMPGEPALNPARRKPPR
jgi:TfoX/Sxy family transcriptional regulator of competence genes